MSELTLDELAAAFRAGTLTHARWTHAAHLRVGTWYVHHHGAAAALDLLRDEIRRLNEHHGTVNGPMSGYHETITAAYVTLIARFLAGADPAGSLEERAERLVSGPLGERRFLLRFWSPDVLMSARARAAWVPPNLGPLELPCA